MRKKPQMDLIPKVSVAVLLSFLSVVGLYPTLASADTLQCICSFNDVASPHLLEEEDLALDFSHSVAETALGKGWVGSNRAYYWSADPGILWAAHLNSVLNLTLLSPRALECEVRLKQRATQSLPGQKITIFWEGQKLTDCEFTQEDGWQEKSFHFEVPQECQKIGKNEVLFQSRYAVSEVDLGGGKDLREVAFGLISLTLKEKTPPPPLPKEALNFKEKGLGQAPGVRAHFPVKLPASDMCELRMQLPPKERGARLWFRWDTVDGMQEELLFPQQKPLDKDAVMAWNLAPWAGAVVEVVFDSTQVTDNKTVFWGSPGLFAPEKKSAREPEKAMPWPDTERVILIILDACRADALSCYGNRYQTTPFIDSLAQKGLRFENCISAATSTFPSTSSLLSSLLVFQHGARVPKDSFNYSALSLPQRLKEEKGIYTACVAQNAFLSTKRNLTKRFDQVEEVFNVETMKTQEVTQRALAIANEKRNEPFFMYVHYMPPHAPYGVNNKYLNTFSDDPNPLIDPSRPDLLNFLREPQLLAALNNSHAMEQLRIRYFEALRNVDEEVQKLVFGLQKLGLGSETTLMVLADHGEEFGEHGWLSHSGPPFNTQCRVPLIMTTLAKDGIGVQKLIKNHVQTQDVFPTVCTLLNAAPGEHVQGTPLIASSDEKDDEVLAYSCCAPIYKLNEAFFFKQHVLLYSKLENDRALFRAEDRAQRYNLAPGYPVLTNYYLAIAENWQQQKALEFNTFSKDTPPETPSAPQQDTDVEDAEESLRALGYL